MNRKILFIVILSAPAFLITGCEMFGGEAVSSPSDAAGTGAKEPMVVGQTNQSLERRFGQEGSDKMDAVKAAVMWSEKYQELSLATEQLREKNTQFVLENERLTRDAGRLESELKRTQAELAEANELLGQFQQELVRWKSDVLGFRDEMRGAESSQLAALAKILKLLGAESVQETPAPPTPLTPPAPPTKAAANTPAKSRDGGGQ